ncbi:hypothetical protein [Parvularcula lutaonensis]|uniref:hypothetical protein n=1 Tax=Parvularcula lutaonensis TaxID=491923 RepID=UPI00167BDD84|nr:hypothetical protein [Parvularcula lutaonensis]GGY39989.1 hypothetical protein GCM10007148_05540 [Parvularcula lutaonensis]
MRNAVIGGTSALALVALMASKGSSIAALSGDGLDLNPGAILMRSLVTGTAPETQESSLTDVRARSEAALAKRFEEQGLSADGAHQDGKGERYDVGEDGDSSGHAKRDANFDPDMFDRIMQALADAEAAADTAGGLDLGKSASPLVPAGLGGPTGGDGTSDTPDGSSRAGGDTGSAGPIGGGVGGGVPVGGGGTPGAVPGGNSPVPGGNPVDDDPEADTPPEGDNPPGDNPPGDNPPGDNPPGDNPPGDNPPGDNPPGDNPPDCESPVAGMPVPTDGIDGTLAGEVMPSAGGSGSPNGADGQLPSDCNGDEQPDDPDGPNPPGDNPPGGEVPIPAPFLLLPAGLAMLLRKRKRA